MADAATLAEAFEVPPEGVLDVLSLMPWEIRSVAMVLRKAGRAIPPKVELEQAHALAFLLVFAKANPDGWRSDAIAALQTVEPAYANRDQDKG